jgi:hypothetical protein
MLAHDPIENRASQNPNNIADDETDDRRDEHLLRVVPDGEACDQCDREPSDTEDASDGLDGNFAAQTDPSVCLPDRAPMA